MHCNFYIKTICMIFCLYCLSFVQMVQPMWCHFACLHMSPLSLSASLLEHCQCFPREDVFLIFALGSVRGNTVPRGSIDPYTPRSRECIGYYDLCRSCHSISSLSPVEYQEIHPYNAMNIDIVKINTSLIMMREWQFILLASEIWVEWFLWNSGSPFHFSEVQSHSAVDTVLFWSA